MPDLKLALTDALAKALPGPKPDEEPLRYYDAKVPGFFLRVTDKGIRSYVLRYRTKAGRQRDYTLGRIDEWKAKAARAECERLRPLIKQTGFDPLAEQQAERDAESFGDLCDRFIDEHLPKLKPSTQYDYKRVIEHNLKPALGKMKLAEISFNDINKLHRTITKQGSTYRANTVVRIASKIFNQAILWKATKENPCKGIELNTEYQRRRYLSNVELSGLSKALAAHEDKQACNVIRLLLLTGARRGETRQARWVDFDLGRGVWSKPPSSTKTDEPHQVPLSAPARQLLSDLRQTADDELARIDAELTKADDADRQRLEQWRERVRTYVFPSNVGKHGYRVEVKDVWAELCVAAGIENARLHDLRHSHASLLAGAGVPLHTIGALLGHSQPSTTHRYAHLAHDPLLQASERVGAILDGINKPANVQPMKRRK